MRNRLEVVSTERPKYKIIYRDSKASAFQYLTILHPNSQTDFIVSAYDSRIFCLSKNTYAFTLDV